jgi:hypothetical protein
MCKEREDAAKYCLLDRRVDAYHYTKATLPFLCCATALLF